MAIQACTLQGRHRKAQAHSCFQGSLEPGIAISLYLSTCVKAQTAAHLAPSLDLLLCHAQLRVMQGRRECEPKVVHTGEALKQSIARELAHVARADGEAVTA